MSTSNSKANAAAHALPWKNSLLAKEESEVQQNPLNYFQGFIYDTDIFSNVYERIVAAREDGNPLTFLEFVSSEDHNVTAAQEHELFSFLVVQDPRGVNWVCPAFLDTPEPSSIRPLGVNFDDQEFPPFLAPASFGTLSITGVNFLSACSRGFDNAARLMLGEESVKLNNGYRLVAVFYIYPRPGYVPPDRT